MLFPTFDFLLFALPVLVGFWALSGRPVARVAFLTAASYFFYMAGPKTDPPPAPWYFAGLLLVSTTLDFICGQKIHALSQRAKAAGKSDPVAALANRGRNRWLMLSMVGNLGLLGYFKYTNFLIQAFSDVAASMNIFVPALHLDVVLPLGISFYTFQSLSYTLDIWRGKLEPETSFARFALFVAFFPQLVAGPIVRASEFLPQLRRGPSFSRDNFESGAFRIVRGLAKKVVLGDWVASQLSDVIFDAPGTFTSAELLLALYGYTLQIYADFSGYSDIAIGLGLMLGFKLPENFDRPYQSLDIAEYWRRWHITLSSWLRDYLFFQVLAKFGARAGYFAVWLTMFLVGMWHGASWNFVIYANIHAAAMVFNRWNRTRQNKNKKLKKKGKHKPLPLRLVYWSVGTAVGFALGAGLVHTFLHLPWPQAAGLAGFGTIVLLGVCALPIKGGKLVVFAHIFLTFHLIVLSRIFFRAPDLDTARAFVEGLVALNTEHLIRPGLVSIWVYAALVGGLVLHFTPKRWVDETLMKLFRRTPGVLLGLAFVALCYGLMLLLQGAPRAFIYFQF